MLSSLSPQDLCTGYSPPFFFLGTPLPDWSSQVPERISVSQAPASCLLLDHTGMVTNGQPRPRRVLLHTAALRYTVGAQEMSLG